MKSLSALLLVAACLICLSSCTKKKHESQTRQTQKDSLEISLSGLDLDLRALRMTELPMELFSYEGSDQLSEHLRSTFQDFLTEVDELRESDERIDHVIFNINFSATSAILKSIYFLDTDNQQVIDLLEIGSTSDEIDWEEIYALLFGVCKSGWTSQGTCSSKSCIAEKTEKILSESLEGNGSCVQIEYARGLLSVRICTKSCN